MSAPPVSTPARRRPAAALVLASSVLVAIMAGASACSVLLDWNGLTGAGKGDTGNPLDGSAMHDGAIADGGVSAVDGPVPDGMVTACTGGTCAPNTPSGWLGPFSVYVGPGTPPPCGTTTYFNGNAGLVAPPATCAPCACAAPTGVTCGDPVLSFFLDLGCTKVDPTMPTLSVSSSCTATALGGIGATLAGPAPSGGSCAASGGDATKDAAAWKESVRACVAMTSGSCVGGDLCVTGAPGATDICILQSGSVTTCPAAYPAGPQVFYTDIDDSRGCGKCTCSSPTDSACTIGSPAIDVYQDFVCSSPTTMLMAPNACTSVTGFVKLVGTPTLADAGSCSVSGGGMPTGTATPTGETSFCCLH